MAGPEIAPQKYAFPEYAGRTLVVERGTIKPRFLFHYHSDYELTLIRAVTGRRLVGDSTQDFAGMDLVLLPPNMPHAWAFETEVVRRARPSFVAVAFSLESIGLQFLGKPEMSGIKRLLRGAGRGVVFSPKVAAAAAQKVDALYDARDLEQLLTFLSALDVLSTSRGRRPIVSKDYDPSFMEREYEVLSSTLNFIHERSNDRISLRDAAEHVNMSVPTFTRFFRRATGTTFVAYLNRWRIGRACVLLRETQRSVLEISNTVGYNNLSHFNRQFLKLEGITPREYREAHGEE